MRFWRHNSQVAFSLGVAMGIGATFVASVVVVSGQWSVAGCCRLHLFTYSLARLFPVFTCVVCRGRALRCASRLTFFFGLLLLRALLGGPINVPQKSFVRPPVTARLSRRFSMFSDETGLQNGSDFCVSGLLRPEAKVAKVVDPWLERTASASRAA
jgi:hypothetical protein